MNGSLGCDRMTDDDQARIPLEAHFEPQKREDYLRQCSHSFLKNNSLPNCHYDFSAGRGMVFTTEAGKECVRIHRYFEKTDDPRGLVSVEHDLSSERYWDEIRKASSIDPW